MRWRREREPTFGVIGKGVGSNELDGRGVGTRVGSIVGPTVVVGAGEGSRTSEGQLYEKYVPPSSTCIPFTSSTFPFSHRCLVTN